MHWNRSPSFTKTNLAKETSLNCHKLQTWHAQFSVTCKFDGRRLQKVDVFALHMRMREQWHLHGGSIELNAYSATWAPKHTPRCDRSSVLSHSVHFSRTGQNPTMFRAHSAPVKIQRQGTKDKVPKSFSHMSKSTDRVPCFLRAG